jgi:hypothetical protein
MVLLNDVSGIDVGMGEIGMTIEHGKVVGHGHAAPVAVR